MIKGLKDLIKELSETDFWVLFDEIKAFHKPGMLAPNGALRRLARAAQEEVGRKESMLRIVEDAVLFEMASCLREIIWVNNDANIEGCKLLAKRDSSHKLEVYIIRNDKELQLWDVAVVAGGLDGPILGFFSSEKEAQAFVKRQGYLLKN